jgi:hypothetical protein
MLIGEQPTGTAATKAAMPTPVQMPDLIDTGDQDDLATSSGHASIEQNSGNSAYVSSVDDLLGGEPISDTSVTADSNGSDPFADVSFHEAETKETNDLFSGLTVEEKSSTTMHDSSSDKNELPDIFGSSPDSFNQGSVTDQGTVNDLIAGLNLNGTGHAQSAVKAEPNSNSGSQFFDTKNESGHVPSAATLNDILGQNSLYQQQQTPLQYSFPQHMMLNQSFPGQQLNYGAMGILLAQQQQLLQSFGNFNAGLGNSSFNSMNGGNTSVLPDIFNSSNQPQNHVAVMSSSKKDDNKAFDFVSVCISTYSLVYCPAIIYN